MTRRVPPVTWVAMAYGMGIASALLLGGRIPAPLLLMGALLAPILLWIRPWPFGALLTCIVAGAAIGTLTVDRRSADCRLALPAIWSGQIEGRFVGRPAEGTTTPFVVEVGAPGGCTGEVRAVLAAGSRPPPVGRRLRVSGGWQGRTFPDPAWADRAGILRLSADWELAQERGVVRRHFPLRGAVQERIADLWDERTAPMVEALVLARRERLDPALRDAFARSGTAHLLAISGFHVGVVAVLLLGLLRALGLPRLKAEAGAVAGSWLYVLAIGAPQAAVRAAVLLSLILAARVRGRPVSGLGALSSALLLILLVRPEWLGAVGFQLSFAGTAGLVLLRRPFTEIAERAVARVLARFDRPTGPGRRARWLRVMTEGLGAGVAATLATTPLVAWHFDRVSLVGIPLTLVITPLVSLAIPGVAVALLASWLHAGLGAFLAGGVALLLDTTALAVTWTAALPGASVWISRDAIALATSAVIAIYLVLWRVRRPRLRAPCRWLVACIAGICIATARPLFPASGTVEVHMIDVGQGDAVAVRLPTRRWILFDAGPRSPTFDAGERRVTPYLRRHGADRLAAMILTHPHLDHIGGAPAILRSIEVGGVVDPGYAVGSRDYLAVLEAAMDRGTYWWAAGDAAARGAFSIDGVTFTILHPDLDPIATERVADLNDLSVVVLLEWQGAAVLLTGDAPAEVEHEVLSRLPLLAVLKVGHHGSRTSTSASLIERASPSVALIGVGDGNRFGHPHEEVVRRLDASGSAVYRTDRDGDVRVILRGDGTATVAPAR